MTPSAECPRRRRPGHRPHGDPRPTDLRSRVASARAPSSPTTRTAFVASYTPSLPRVIPGVGDVGASHRGRSRGRATRRRRRAATRELRRPAAVRALRRRATAPGRSRSPATSGTAARDQASLRAARRRRSRSRGRVEAAADGVVAAALADARALQPVPAPEPSSVATMIPVSRNGARVRPVARDGDAHGPVRRDGDVGRPVRGRFRDDLPRPARAEPAADDHARPLLGPREHRRTAAREPRSPASGDRPARRSSWISGPTRSWIAASGVWWPASCAIATMTCVPSSRSLRVIDGARPDRALQARHPADRRRDVALLGIDRRRRERDLRCRAGPRSPTSGFVIVTTGARLTGPRRRPRPRR